MATFKKYLYYATLALFVYMPFHIFISQYLSTYTNGLDAWKIGKDVFAAALVSVLVCTILITRKYTRSYIVFVGLAIVYLLLHIVSWIATDQPNDTGLLATVYNNRLIWYLLIGYSVALLVPERRPRGVFARVLIGVSLTVCLVGIAQWFLPKDIMMHFGYSLERGVKPNFFIDDKPDFPRIFSTIRDPNSLGAFLILPSTLLIMCLVRFWKTRHRMMLIGLLMLHGLALLLTFSRGAWIGMCITLVIAFVVIFKSHLVHFVRKFMIPIGVILIMLVAGLFISRDSYFVENVLLHSDESTQSADPNELRLQFYQKSVDGIADNPEGNGPGTAGLVSTRLAGGGLLTENYYLQIAYEVGLLGLLLLGVFLAYTVSLLWPKRGNLVTQSLLMSLVGLSFVNLLIHGWSNEAIAASWFILAGLTLAPESLESAVVGPHAKSAQLVE